ncbi:SMC-Scp complex subunit ScpB [Candidatus Woesearchaeota archaeon]|nr:SMC-Scp complex subunit ScpB [Candidatus Woesearchaeota archaeon]
MDAAELRNKTEAILFAAGKKVSVDYIAKLTRTPKEEVLKALAQLKEEYAAKGSSLLVVDDGESWKFVVRESYSPIVRKIVPTTELTKTVIETLAVIAWKAPVLQSEVIRIRTNKAYDHLSEIEKAGLISREKHGRTQLIKLAQKFYDYFDVHSEQEVKDKFRKLGEQAEKEAEAAKEAQHDTAGGVPEVQAQPEVQPEGQAKN